MILEASILKKLEHPLIVKYIDSFKDRDYFAYLVIEYAHDLDLQSDMKKRFSQNKNYTDTES